MESMILEAMIQGGPMAIFAAWLAWNNSKQDENLAEMYAKFFKKLEDMNAKHETNRENLENKYEQRNDLVRERWLSVVEKVEKERDEAQRENARTVGQLNESIKELTMRIELLNQKIK
tara:strand:+ start:62 stop:415 length:354 start_codon:yes stop_codon:yes gene_type:complete